MIHLDNGPDVKSFVFQTVNRRLGVEWKTHMPAGSDDRRTAARSKREVERPFRSVKEADETLYHFHESGTEAEVNLWLSNFINNFSDKPHRREPHSRIEDWWPTSRMPASGRCVP